MEKTSNSVRFLRRYFASLLEATYGPDEANALIMILFEHHFNINRITMALNPELSLNDMEHDIIEKSVNELLTNRPVQYVTGKEVFCDMDFFVNENVLIPRPETEELVYHIKHEHEGITSANAVCEVLDIGTGSGCIAVSLAKLLSNSHITAIDISTGALEVARRNAIANHATVDFIQADILSRPQLDRTFDVIVSNPPYVCDCEKKDMRPNVLDFEPSTALFVSDNDPLLFYREIISFAQDTLKPDGSIWFEINERFGADTIQLCKDNGFQNTMVIKDFRGKDRFIRARK
ncbi:MAG: peptide chain release factor N(5)-glutamine methyltransferase [Bacteroidales bacterium]|nr:peptide chain release factor N(5)-glutamine methyltransferase [Bacteroidales bacterium]